ncbi:MAG: hypothetical protein NC405_03685 [Odoribacter sp.]|nr:hypothetical protein [Odoribacter sp.]
MASDLQQQIDRVQAKTRVLGEKYMALKANYDSARSEISDLKARLLARDNEVRQLHVKIENLTVATYVNASAGDLDSSRAIIADLVREIDRCITDLLE